MQDGVLHRPIYMDNHATTRVDPRVVEAMLPFFAETFGNAASTTHEFGLAAKAAVNEARESIAASIGATEGNCLTQRGDREPTLPFGVAEAVASEGKHLLSLTTEHPAVLDPWPGWPAGASKSRFCP